MLHAPASWARSCIKFTLNLNDWLSTIKSPIIYCISSQWDLKLIDWNIPFSRRSYHNSWDTASLKFHLRGEPGTEAERRQEGNLLPPDSGPVIAYYTPRVAAVHIPAPVKPIYTTRKTSILRAQSWRWSPQLTEDASDWSFGTDTWWDTDVDTLQGIRSTWLGRRIPIIPCIWPCIDD